MADETQERVDPFEIFPKEIQESVRGLTYVGYLEKAVTFCGHSFVLRLLRPSEKAAIALAVQPWRNTLSEAEIWSNAHVAMALKEIDGSDSFCPQAGPDLTSYVKARLNYVTNADSGWWQPTLDFLYQTYLALEAKQFEAIEALQNLAERSQQPSQPSADSLTAPGTSVE